MDNVQGAHGFSGHCTVCLDIVQGISGQCPHFPQSIWTLSRESMDNLQGDSGQCPLSPWTLSSLSGLPDLCPEYPWSLPRLSIKSMDIAQGVHGLLSRETVDNVVHGHCPVCVGSLDFFQSIHGLCPDFSLIPWTMSRESMDIVQ